MNLTRVGKENVLNPYSNMVEIVIHEKLKKMIN